MSLLNSYKIVCSDFGDDEEFEYKCSLYMSSPIRAAVLSDVAEAYVRDRFWDDPRDSLLNTSVIVTVDGIKYEVDIEPSITTYSRKVKTDA